MAKDDIGGVWRTIGGRRVFIKDGQDLASAMKDSGKFNIKAKDDKNAYNDKEELEKAKRDLEEAQKEYEALEMQYDENDEMPDYIKEQLNDYEEKIKDAKARINEYSKSPATINNKKDEDDYNLYKRAKENPDSIDPMTENSTDWERLDEKYSDRYKKENNLPQKTEIKTQGTSNRKEVSENIQAHILEYYDKPEDFLEQMDAMDYLPTKWRAGEELAKGGSYLIYNGDMSDFLNELKINPKGKTFSEDKAFNMYTSLIGRESAKLYDRLQKNAFQKYLKEHPGSKMSFEDFKDMRK